MCGICGVLAFDGTEVRRETVTRMTEQIAHRGPDGAGVWTHEGVGLGHRRLAIIDLTPAAAQPMSNADGTIIITYNGELYNFRCLRQELENAGYKFRSNSDTETILYAYQEWGVECLSRFNGMFAFAIWDQRKRRLIIARDRFGVKPLYYSNTGNHFVFGSEIKAMLTCPGVNRGVSHQALNEYFTFQNVISDRTLFEGVRLLPPGHYLTVDLPSSEPRIGQYWDYDFTRPDDGLTQQEAVEEVHRLFVRAVERQLISDVPIGAYLSGGMDSGSIVTVARRKLGRLCAFTGGFDLSSATGLELGFDERAQAEAIANLLKVEHYEMVMHAGDMENVMPELIWHLEDLRVGQCYPNYYIARLASKFVKVSLSGAGGDELFGGYPWRYYRGLNGGTQPGDYYQRYYGFWQRLVPDEDKPCLFTPGVYGQVRGDSTFDLFCSVIGKAGLALQTREELFNASLYFELKTFLHGLLVVEDKISMAHSLETRVPFLDNDLVDFACRVPARYKLRNLDQQSACVDENDVGKYQSAEMRTGEGKAVLRDAMRRVMPPEVTKRTKQGFSAPDAGWFRGESVDYVNQLLLDPKARIYDFLNRPYVSQRLRQHASGEQNHRLFIWSAISFEWWLRAFMC